MSGFSEIQDVNIDIGSDGEVHDSPGDQAPVFEDFHPSNDKPASRGTWNPREWAQDAKKDFMEFKADGFRLTEKRKVLLKAIFGEGLCTLMFMYVVMAAHVNAVRANSTTGTVVTSFGENFVLGALSTAFVSVALIYSFADVSGAHFNPAVTFATMVTGKTSIKKGLAYIGIQLLAAILATGLLSKTFPDNEGTFSKSTTMDLIVVNIDPRVGAGTAFIMEIILSFVLVYVIFATAFDTVDTKNAVTVADPLLQKSAAANGTVVAPRADKSVGRNLTIYTTSGSTKAGFAPIAIGFTLGFLTFIGGSVSGGAFNPARVFGPALLSGNWNNHWVYWCGDFFGAALAGLTQRLFAHAAVQSSGGSSNAK